MKTKLKEIKPNLGIERAYLKELRSILLRIKKDINGAKDTNTTKFGNRIDYLLDRWQNRLGKLGIKLAKRFIRSSRTTYDKQFMNEIRKAGFTVKFRLNDDIEKVLDGAIAQNVGLIKSLGTEYLERVQQQVWEGVTNGYDLGQISKNLVDAYGISDRRAAFIARDQGAKAHAVIERERRKEAGITQAVWLHSHAGKTPRPSHVRANGKVFDIEKGLYLDGEWLLPGTIYNCRCGSRSLLDIP